MTVTLVLDDTLRTGDCDVAAEIAEGGRVGSLVLPDGERVLLGEQTIVLGRLPDCDVVVSDPKASRRHAEVRPAGHGYVVTDLGSTNGTKLNGIEIHEQPLHDGDLIGIGATVFRFEAS